MRTGASAYNKYSELHTPGKENTPEGGVYFVLYVFVLYFVLNLYCICIFRRRPPVTVAAAASAMAPRVSCLGCTLGTWLCSMSKSIIYHVSCYRFVSQHTYIYHIGPHAHVDTDSDSRQQQQPPAPAPAPAVAQVIQKKNQPPVLCIIRINCIMYCIMYDVFPIPAKPGLCIEKATRSALHGSGSGSSAAAASARSMAR
jgi:hypothetical protein